ncbi:MAG: hypothetical protein IKR39_09050 [Lachnospiraceae bacterium]|nr:hypothetical protein [Lachnospiraceae bacterium]
MRELMLLFMLFVLGIWLNRGKNDYRADLDYKPTAELQELVQELKEEESVIEDYPEYDYDIEAEEGATYEAEITTSDIQWEGSKRPLYVEEGSVYSLSCEMGSEYNEYCFYKTDLKTKNEKKIFELTLDYDAPGISYIHASDTGGYIAVGGKWTGESMKYYFMTLDNKGTLLDTKPVDLSYKMPEYSYFIDTPACDGTYLYISYQGEGASGGILVFDTNFNFLKQVVSSPNAYAVVGKDGFAYMLDSYNAALSVYNPDNDELAKAITVRHSYSLFTGYDNELLYGDNDIYSYDCRTGNEIKLFSLSDFGVDCFKLFDIDFIYRDYNGDIVIIYQVYGDDSNTSTNAFEARVTRVD